MPQYRATRCELERKAAARKRANEPLNDVHNEDLWHIRE